MLANGSDVSFTILRRKETDRSCHRLDPLGRMIPLAPPPGATVKAQRSCQANSEAARSGDAQPATTLRIRGDAWRGLLAVRCSNAGSYRPDSYRLLVAPQC